MTTTGIRVAVSWSRLGLALVALSAIGLLLVSGSAEAAGSKPPSGAVILPDESLKEVGGVYCGRRTPLGSWRPGELLESGHFIAYEDLARNSKVRADGLSTKSSKLKKKASKKKGKAKKKLSAKSKKLKKQARAAREEASNYSYLASSKFSSCNPNSGGGGGPVYPGGQAVRFDLTNAVGLALQSPNTVRHTRQSGASSNLQVVEPGGSIRDAIVSGNVRVQRFVVGPDGRLYVIFMSPVSLTGQMSPGQPNNLCVLAQIDMGSGEATCVDRELQMIDGYMPNSRPVQFDSGGGIYYLGMTRDGRRVLRRSVNGEITDLVAGSNISIQEFHVLPDGRVLLAGITASTNSWWVRRVSPQGSLKTLSSQNGGGMATFPDGNVYLTVEGVFRRYIASTDELDPKPWAAWDTNAHFNLADQCNGEGNAWGFCSGGPTPVRTMTTSDGQVYGFPSKGLARYYPRLEGVNSQVVKPAVGAPVGNDLLVSGLNGTDKYVTTLLDPTTGAERVLLDPQNEVEVYRLNYRQGSNEVMFDGLRFADNRYVLGQINLTSGAVSYTATSGTKWEDFQTFG